MKKSKKLMLGTIAAMGALAIGAGAVSTFAWFQVTDASVTYTPDTSDAVQTIANPYSVGSFEVTLSFGTISNSITPTDGSGNVYYYLADGTTKVQDTSVSASAKSATFTVTGTLTYTQDSSTTLSDAQIKAAWESLDIDALDVSYACSSGAKVKISVVNAAGAIGATAAASTEKDNAFDTSNLSFSSGVASLGTTTLYVAIAADESNVETAGARGTITATPKVHD